MNKRHYEHTLPNIRGSLSNTYVSDLKSANNKTFSSYLKVNANSGQLQYFQENPDIRRNTTRRTAQTDDMQNQQHEQKKGSRQAV